MLPYRPALLLLLQILALKTPGKVSANKQIRSSRVQSFERSYFSSTSVVLENDEQRRLGNGWSWSSLTSYIGICHGTDNCGHGLCKCPDCSKAHTKSQFRSYCSGGGGGKGGKGGGGGGGKGGSSGSGGGGKGSSGGSGGGDGSSGGGGGVDDSYGGGGGGDDDDDSHIEAGYDDNFYGGGGADDYADSYGGGGYDDNGGSNGSYGDGGKYYDSENSGSDSTTPETFNGNGSGFRGPFGSRATFAIFTALFIASAFGTIALGAAALCWRSKDRVITKEKLKKVPSTGNDASTFLIGYDLMGNTGNNAVIDSRATRPPKRILGESARSQQRKQPLLEDHQEDSDDSSLSVGSERSAPPTPTHPPPSPSPPTPPPPSCPPSPIHSEDVPFDEEVGSPFDESTVDSIIERNLVEAKKIVSWDDERISSELDSVIDRSVAAARSIVSQQTYDNSDSDESVYL